MASTLVPIIVICIIIAQFFFFSRNVKRMKEFSEIFKDGDSWGLIKNNQGFVSGILGEGNDVFTSIKWSINKYLGSATGSVVDFQLLKDAVDRHCESVEEDISAQTPVPLYCGLAGTMAGVIVGLTPLIFSGALIYLLNGNIPAGETKEYMDQMAASGINELLKGVAWAMTASIFGIILTTINSLMFKKNKLVEEEGKNAFLAWMQSSLLPELPSDTSDALNRLVKNLNRFNSVFATNTEELKSTLNRVNEVYKSQDKIIQAVKDMDVMKMAQANVRVLQELQKCTEQIGDLSAYLYAVNEYTQTIKGFTDRFDSESNRLHVLEEIRNFFTRHKGEIAKNTADAGDALNEALRQLRATTENNLKEFTKNIVEQSENFKTMLKEEQQAFQSMSQEIKEQFSDQLKQTPMLQQNLEKISLIPGSLEILASRIEKSNLLLEDRITKIMSATAKAIAEKHGTITVEPEEKEFNVPRWITWTVIPSVIIMGAYCLLNIVLYIISLFIR